MNETLFNHPDRLIYFIVISFAVRCGYLRGFFAVMQDLEPFINGHI